MSLQQDNLHREYTFNNLLVESIEKVMNYVLGKHYSDVIFEHMKEKGCKNKDIPNNLTLFQRTIHTSIAMHIHPPAPLLLMFIVEELCEKIGIEYDEEKAYHFIKYVTELKQVYKKEKGGEIR